MTLNRQKTDMIEDRVTKQKLSDTLSGISSSLADNTTELRTTQNNPTNSSGAIVTFVDDDTTWLYPQWWNPIIQAKGINISLACITGAQGGIGNGGYMTLQQLQDAQAQGNDILVHSQLDIGAQTPDVAEADFIAGQNWLKANGFNGWDTVVYGGGLLSTNVSIKNVARKHFKYGIATWDADNVFVNTMPVDNWALKRIYIQNSTLDQLKAAVDNANANNQWLITLSHSHDFAQADVDKINAFIDYVKSINVPIMKFSEAVKYKGNAVALGEYTDSNSTFISVKGDIKAPVLKSSDKTLDVIANPAGNAMDLAISGYPYDRFTQKLLDGDTDTFLHNGGSMIVFRSSVHDLYSYALFLPYETNNIYKRRWDWNNNVWFAWEKVNKMNIAQSVDVGGILAQPITYFDNGSVTITPISDNASSPNSTGGILTTYRMIDDTYSYQLYKLYNAKTTFHRRWWAGTWTAWEQSY